MTTLIVSLAILFLLLVLYAACCVAHDADEHAERLLARLRRQETGDD